MNSLRLFGLKFGDYVRVEIDEGRDVVTGCVASYNDDVLIVDCCYGNVEELSIDGISAIAIYNEEGKVVKRADFDNDEYNSMGGGVGIDEGYCDDSNDPDPDIPRQLHPTPHTTDDTDSATNNKGRTGALEFKKDDMVRISSSYPNSDAAGQIGFVVEVRDTNTSMDPFKIVLVETGPGIRNWVIEDDLKLVEEKTGASEYEAPKVGDRVELVAPLRVQIKNRGYQIAPEGTVGIVEEVDAESGCLYASCGNFSTWLYCGEYRKIGSQEYDPGCDSDSSEQLNPDRTFEDSKRDLTSPGNPDDELETNRWKGNPQSNSGTDAGGGWKESKVAWREAYQEIWDAGVYDGKVWVRDNDSGQFSNEAELYAAIVRDEDAPPIHVGDWENYPEEERLAYINGFVFGASQEFNEPGPESDLFASKQAAGPVWQRGYDDGWADANAVDESKGERFSPPELYSTDYNDYVAGYNAALTQFDYEHGAYDDDPGGAYIESRKQSCNADETYSEPTEPDTPEAFKFKPDEERDDKMSQEPYKREGKMAAWEAFGEMVGKNVSWVTNAGSQMSGLVTHQRYSYSSDQIEWKVKASEGSNWVLVASGYSDQPWAISPIGDSEGLEEAFAVISSKTASEYDDGFNRGMRAFNDGELSDKIEQDEASQIPEEDRVEWLKGLSDGYASAKEAEEEASADYRKWMQKDSRVQGVVGHVRRIVGGGTDFYVEAEGSTMAEAFRAAQDQARYEYGHGGYTGTVAEKDGFIDCGVLSPDELKDCRAVMLEYGNPDPALVKRLSPFRDKYFDKWGPALGFKVGNVFAFMGIASC